MSDFLRRIGFYLLEHRVIFIAFLLALSFQSTVWIIDIVEHKHRSNIEKTLQAMYANTQETIDFWKTEKKALIKQAIHQKEIIDLSLTLVQSEVEMDAASSSTLQDLREAIKPVMSEAAFNGMFVIDPDGINRASMSNRDVGEMNSLSHFPELISRVFQGEIVFSPIMSLTGEEDLGLAGSQSNREMIMFVLGPIKNWQGEVEAVLALSMNPCQTFYKITAPRLGETGETYLFNQQGFMLSSSRFQSSLVELGLLTAGETSEGTLLLADPERLLTQQNPFDSQKGEYDLTWGVSQAVTGELGRNIEGYRDYRGVPVIGQWGWDHELSLGIITKQDVAEAYDYFYYLERFILIIALVFLFLASTAYFLFSYAVNTRKALQQRLEGIIENANEGVVMINHEGTIELVNPAVETMFGYSTDELLGQSISQLLPPKYAVHRRGFFRRYLTLSASKMINQKTILEAERKDASHFYVELAVKRMAIDGQVLFVGTLRDMTQERQDRRHLEALNAELRITSVVAQATHYAVIVCDPEGKIEWVNLGFEKLTKFEASEVIGIKPGRILQGEHTDPNTERLMSEAIRAHKPFKGEILNYDKFNHAYWIDIQINPVFNEQGQLTQFVGIQQDITEKKQLYEALEYEKNLAQQANQSLSITQSALSRSGIAEFWNEAKTGQTIRVNQQACQLLGYSESELLSMTIPEFDANVDEAFFLLQAEYIKEHGWARFESVYLTQLGSKISKISVEIISEFRVVNGDDVLISFVTDITERKQAERELLDAKERLELAASAGIIGIWDWNVEAGELYWDKVMYRLFGLENELEDQDPLVKDWLRSINSEDEDTLLAKWLGLIHPEDRTQVHNWINLMLTGQDSLNKEYRILWPDGSIHYVKSASETVFKDAKPIRVVGITYDQTEHKNSEQALMQAQQAADSANKAKSNFLAAMSHEIRTPLNGVVGTIDMLAHSKLDEQQVNLVQTANQSAHLLLTIIDDILDFSKIESNRFDLEQVPVCVESILESVTDNLLSQAQRNDVELLVYVNPDIPMIISDPVRLQQVLFNLSGNAIKFSKHLEKRQGKVWISLDFKPESGHSVLLVTVKDNGIGISQQSLQKIFSPFSQAEADTTRRFGGSGLGLAITKNIIDAMQGRISVQSRLEQGATFNVELPIEAVNSPKSSALSDLRQVNILVLSSDSRVSQLVTTYLCDAGAEVMAADMNPVQDPIDDLCASFYPDAIVIYHPSVESSYQNIKTQLQQLGLCSDARYVLIKQNYRRLARSFDDMAVMISINGMSRRTLLNAVASIVGRESVIFEELESNSYLDLVDLNVEQQKGRVLLVEDNETNQKVIKQQLTLLGCQVDIANHGQEALDILQSRDYALIITDCHMPIMDGYSLSRAVREREQVSGQHVPILALTADALKGTAQRCFAAGMDHYLTKPVELNQLKSVLNQIQPFVSNDLKRPVEHSINNQSSTVMLQVVDPTVLPKLLGIDDQAMLIEFYQDFLVTSAETIKAIKWLQSAAHYEPVGELAHKLKSSAKTIGAHTLAESCLVVEGAVQQGQLDEIDLMIERLLNHYQAVTEWIDKI